MKIRKEPTMFSAHCWLHIYKVYRYFKEKHCPIGIPAGRVSPDILSMRNYWRHIIYSGCPETIKLFQVSLQS